jgi:CheY-like chemotaxis protein
MKRQQPFGRLRPRQAHATAAEASGSGADSGEAVRILLVEDEAIIAIMVEDLLTDLGYEVVGPASNVAEALRLAQSEELAGAVLDVNVGGTTVYPVADALAARQIPFMFVSGYGPAGIEPRYVDTPVLTKPILDADFERAVRNLRARSRQG